jgi:uncharacterized protein (TIGR02246 family)
VVARTDAQSVLERYCDAWNRADLDAVFALFAEDAQYEGTSHSLNGRDAIRKMYERTFASGEARDLVAQPVGWSTNAFSVNIYR